MSRPSTSSDSRVAPSLDSCLCNLAPPRFKVPPPPEPYAFIPEVDANSSRAELVDCDLEGIRGLVPSFEKYSPHDIDSGRYYGSGVVDGQRERVEDVINEFILEHWTKLALATAIGVCLFASAITCILFYYNRKFGARAKAKTSRSQSDTKILTESTSNHSSAFRNANDWAYVRPPGTGSTGPDTLTRHPRGGSPYPRTESVPTDQFYATNTNPYNSIQDGPNTTGGRRGTQQPLLPRPPDLDPPQTDTEYAESVYQTLSHYRPSFSSFRGGLDDPDELDPPLPPPPDVGPTPIKLPLQLPRNHSRYDDIASTAGYNGETLTTRNSGVYDTMQTSLSMLHQLQQQRPERHDPSYGIYEDRSPRFPKIIRRPSGKSLGYEKPGPPPVATKPSNYYHKDSPGFKAMKERGLAPDRERASALDKERGLAAMQFPPPPPSLTASSGYVNDPTLPFRPGFDPSSGSNPRLTRDLSIHSLPRRQLDQHQLEPLVNHDEYGSEGVHIPLRAFQLHDDII